VATNCIRLAMAASAMALAFPCAPAAADASHPRSIEGLWLTDGSKAVVRVAPCGAQLCGNLAAVLDKGPGVPSTDVNNPDPHLRSLPLIGLRTLWGFRRSGDGWNGGRAYDPKSGKSYRSSMALQPDGSLMVTGCVFVICESRRWARVH